MTTDEIVETLIDEVDEMQDADRELVAKRFIALGLLALLVGALLLRSRLRSDGGETETLGAGLSDSPVKPRTE